MKEKIINAIIYGVGGFFLGFLLSVFVGLLSIKIFPYFLGEEKTIAQYCFNTRKDYMTRQELIRCSDIEFRESLFHTGLTVGIIAAIYGFLKKKDNLNLNP